MRLLVAGAIACGVALLAWGASRPMWRAPVLARRNHRGIDVPVGAGVLLAVTVLAVEALLRAYEAVGDGGPDADRSLRATMLVAVLGFCLLGLFDDLAAHGDARGFAGHVRSIVTGQLSTGALKLLAGGVLGIVAAADLAPTQLGDIVLGGALIALCANVGNLLDRAPGRTTKVALVAGGVVLLVATAAERERLTALAIVLGAALGLLVPDLREQMMLGDAGSNVLGAAVGVGIVASAGRTSEVIVLLVVIALNLASERVSFSRVIDRFGPLRALDRLGRRPPEPLP